MIPEQLWTDEEVKLLRQLYPHYPLSHQAFDELRKTRTDSAIRAKAHNLSLRAFYVHPAGRTVLGDPLVLEAIRRVAGKYRWFPADLERIYAEVEHLESKTGRGIADVAKALAEIKGVAAGLKKGMS